MYLNINILIIMRALLKFIPISVLISCNSITFHSGYYDHKGGMGKYKTFNFTPESTQNVLNLESRELMIKLFTDELEDRGYMLDENPDFLVNLDLVLKREITPVNPITETGNEFIYDPEYGRTRASQKLYVNTSATLYIDFIASEDKKVIWQGVAKGLMPHPDKATKSIFKVVKIVFKEFPG